MVVKLAVPTLNVVRGHLPEHCRVANAGSDIRILFYGICLPLWYRSPVVTASGSYWVSLDQKYPAIISVPIWVGSDPSLLRCCNREINIDSSLLLFASFLAFWYFWQRRLTLRPLRSSLCFGQFSLIGYGVCCFCHGIFLVLGILPFSSLHLRVDVCSGVRIISAILESSRCVVKGYRATCGADINITVDNAPLCLNYQNGVHYHFPGDHPAVAGNRTFRFGCCLGVPARR